MAQWHSVESAREQWVDAPWDEDGEGSTLLQSLLDAAREAVLAFAPATTETAPTPVTLTDGAWTVDLSGSGDVVQAILTATEAGVASFVIPEEFRPVGLPGVTNGTTVTYFSGAGVLDATADAPATVTMLWTAATPSEEAPVPDGYPMAQLLQAKNIWNSGKASPSGDFDGGQYSLTTFPLDWQVRQLIRPKRGRPVIG